MGHESLNTTQIYTHVTQKAMKQQYSSIFPKRRKEKKIPAKIKRFLARYFALPIRAGGCYNPTRRFSLEKTLMHTSRIQRRVPHRAKWLKKHRVVGCSKRGRLKQMEVTKMSDEIKNGATVAAPVAANAAAATATPAAAAQPTMAEIVHDPNAPIITIKKLLEAGVHFGHQTRRWNPKMSKFIYGARNGIYIIDLTKSAERISASYKALKAIVDQGGKVLFVGTKPQAQQIVVDEATRSGSFYIAHRWLGGTLTNFRTILTRIKYLKDLEAMEADGTWDKMPKKEVAVMKKEKEKLSRNLEGIKEMRRLPQALVVLDPTIEHNAVNEARRLNIPVFAICDTSDNPDTIDFPIPSNNDGAAAIKLLVAVLADAIVESKGGVTEVSYTKDQGEEATMKDAIRNADVINEQRKAALRQQRKEREEHYAQMQAERMARYAAHDAANGAAPAAASAAAKSVVEEKKETK
jgi:small subunit ribosomal protein S2